MSTYVRLPDTAKEALDCIKAACKQDAAEVVHELASEPNTWALKNEDLTAVLRVEPGNELVLIAVAGKNLVKGWSDFVAWVSESSPHIKSIRVHTLNKAVLKMWKKMGITEINEIERDDDSAEWIGRHVL